MSTKKRASLAAGKLSSFRDRKLAGQAGVAMKYGFPFSVQGSFGLRPFRVGKETLSGGGTARGRSSREPAFPVPAPEGVPRPGPARGEGLVRFPFQSWCKMGDITPPPRGTDGHASCTRRPPRERGTEPPDGSGARVPG